MKLHTGLVIASLLSLGMFSYSCANGDTVSGSGSSNNSGGSDGNNSGGSNGNGSGGSSSNSSGGNNGNGTGGSSSRGGSTGSGGSSSRGGSTGSGGNTTVSTGGTTGAGGTTTPSTGGTTGTTACGSAFAVGSNGLVTMPAVGGGCWSGFASDGGDAGSKIMPMTFAMCGSPCMLTMTGMVNAATADNSYAGYAYLGFNIGEGSSAPATTVTPKGSGITVAFTNTSGSTVRVQLVADAAGTTIWCYTATSSPVTIPYGSFTEECYNAVPGAAYAKQPIMTVQLSVPGGAMTESVNVTLVSVTENP